MLEHFIVKDLKLIEMTILFENLVGLIPANHD